MSNLPKAQAERNTTKEHGRVKSLIYNQPTKTTFFLSPYVSLLGASPRVVTPMLIISLHLH